ncbi:BatA domain-containing protein [Spongiimicrobium salis]|uniref:BatA domain-containing protein n=1 Tax=Spongiimicrobium salis TaxID=1667022 RepID=UPI00374DB73F
MFFANPTYLWALLGLLIPIAIHLWSKKEGNTIQVGSIQFLEESEAKQSKRIQWNELLLLLLRLLILTVLVCILAAPQIRRNLEKTSLTYLVEPSLLGNPEMKNILDTINQDLEVRLLQEGFPEIEGYNTLGRSEEPPAYWQLAQQMGSLRTDSIVVFTKALLLGIKGQRPQVPKNINWIVLPLEASPKSNVIGVLDKDTILELQLVQSSGRSTIFEKRRLSRNNQDLRWNENKDSLIFHRNIPEEVFAMTSPQTFRIQLYYVDSLINEKNKMVAAFSALSKYLGHAIEVVQKQEEEDLETTGFDLTIWLSESVPQRFFGKMLRYKRDVYADYLIAPSTSAPIFYLTAPLNTEHIIESHFAEQLVALLDLPDVGNQIQLDQRQLALEEFLPQTMIVKDQKGAMAVFDLSKWLWPLLVVLLIVERFTAKWRRQ